MNDQEMSPEEEEWRCELAKEARQLNSEPQSCNHRPDMWGDCMECHQPAPDTSTTAPTGTSETADLPTPEPKCKVCGIAFKAHYNCQHSFVSSRPDNDKELPDEVVRSVFSGTHCHPPQNHDWLDWGTPSGERECKKCGKRDWKQENNDKEWVGELNELRLKQNLAQGKAYWDTWDEIEVFIRSEKAKSYGEGWKAYQAELELHSKGELTPAQAYDRGYREASAGLAGEYRHLTETFNKLTELGKELHKSAKEIQSELAERLAKIRADIEQLRKEREGLNHNN